MALASGTKLGPYEILAPVGAGGMGEVYRARDTRLDRTVAIKIVPAKLSSDPTLRQRLEREARAVSKLSHPNICTLHDIGHLEGIDFLVMEFVEGETLEQRLYRGPLPPDQVVRYAGQLAGALAKAHKLGITHRDLKPSNIMLAKSGAKLMDFGLAKTSDARGTTPAGLGVATLTGKGLDEDLLNERTVEQSKLTSEGNVVGTVHYMAPEQLEGKEADARTDIFALGEVIYEMATGRPAFTGKSRASVAAAILVHDPPPITQTQPLAPIALERIVKKCLAKDPDDRWQSASDLAAELTWLAEGISSGSQPSPVAARKKRSWLPWLAGAGLALAIALGWIYFRRPGEISAPVRAFIPPPENTSFVFLGDGAGPLVLSPDGRNLAFVAVTATGAPQIYVRPLDGLQARALPGTDHAWAPFWSPDGRTIGFFADGKLKTIDIQSGGPVSVCDAPNSRGGSWAADGTIVFAPDFRTPIYRVAAAGGTPVQVTHIDENKHTSHRWPFFLPDGKHFLYLAMSHQSPQNNAIYYASVDGKEDRLVLASIYNAQYASGFLLYLRSGQLLAQPFNPATGELGGEAHQVATGVTEDGQTQRAIFTVSSNGVLAYSGGATSQSQLGWFDRSGKELALVGDKFGGLAGDQGEIRLSPKGERVAFSIQGGVNDIWVMDTLIGVRRRLTFGPTGNNHPVWSPDGKWIAYDSATKNGTVIDRRSADGGAEEQMVADPGGDVNLDDWSQDGKYLLYEKDGTWALPLSGDHKAFQVTRPGEADTNYPDLSPDGRWLLYQSNESGRLEVYVVPFGRALLGKWQISNSGGIWPLWRRDGKEIFFLTLDGMVTAVPVVTTTDQLEVGAAHALFRLPGSSYDVSPDGKKFLVNVVGDQNSKPITLVLNWNAELRKR